jgi:SAM-dependent methyltransferase
VSHVLTNQSIPPAVPGEDHDPEGEATLEALSQAPAFNRWMYQTIRPYLASPVLEIGSGIGNLSRFLLNDGLNLTLSDLRPGYCRRLCQTLASHPHCDGVVQLDLVHPAFTRAYADLLGTFQTVFALNVVEHVADDVRAVANCRRLLRPGGRLILLVPAFNILFNRLDRALGHYRRYTRPRLKALYQANGMPVERSFYFNAAAMPGWFLSGALLRQRQLPAWQVRVYNALVPAFRLLDRLLCRSVGLSVIAVGQVPWSSAVPLASRSSTLLTAPR